jgi:hypothetical protein
MVVHLVGTFVVSFAPMLAALIWVMNRLTQRDVRSHGTAPDFIRTDRACAGIRRSRY